MTDCDDLTLLQHAREGSQEAWDVLVRRYNKHFRRLIVRKTNRNWLESEEIAQVVWEQLARHVANGAPIENFVAFATLILERRCIDARRREWRAPLIFSLDAELPTHIPDQEGSTLLELLSADPDEVEGYCIRAETLQTIRVGMALLPAHYRAAVAARVNGLSLRESAELLVRMGIVDGAGNPEKRVENYWYRGLDQLRQVLGSHKEALRS